MLRHVSLEVEPDHLDRTVELFGLRSFALLPGGGRVELMAAPPPAR